MRRKLYFPTSGLPSGYKVKLENGGTNADNAPEALTNLNGIPLTSLGSANGLAQLSVASKIKPEQIGPSIFANMPATLEGPVSLQAGSLGLFVITNYDEFTNYDVTATNGSISISGSVISYTAPDNSVTGDFVVNSANYQVAITNVSSLARPTVTSPVNNATNAAVSLTVTSSAFNSLVGQDTHESSDWQLSRYSDMSIVDVQNLNNTVDKTSWSINNLINATTYYVRVRYRGTNNGLTSWSDVVAFTTIAAAGAIVKPVITSPSNNAINTPTAVMAVCSSFAVSSGVDTFVGSDWQLSDNVNFTNIINEVINSASNETAWIVAGLSNNGTYYVRTKQKGLNSGYSQWSDVVTFTTQDAQAPIVPTYSITADETSFPYVNFVVTRLTGDSEGLYWRLDTNGVEGVRTTQANDPETSNLGYTNLFDTSSNGTGSYVFNLIRGFVENEVIASYTYYPKPTIAVTISTVDGLAPVTNQLGQVLVNNNSVIAYNVDTTHIPNGTTLYWLAENSPNNYDWQFTVATGQLVINNNEGGYNVTLSGVQPVDASANIYTTEVRTTELNVAGVNGVGPYLRVTPQLYSVVPAVNSMSEGGSISFNINTTNVADGTVLYYSMNGTNFNASDVSGGDTANTGSVVINGQNASFSKFIINDGIVESNETFVVNLRTGSITGPIVATSSSVTVINV